MVTPVAIPANGSAGYSPDGQALLSLEKIGPRTGGVLVTDGGGDTEVSITPTVGTNISKLQHLKLICSAVPTGTVVALLKDSNGGGTVLRIELSTAYAIGDVIDFPFPTPLSSLASGEFNLNIPATGGDWYVYAMGYFIDERAFTTP
jgi:hypothetical protein